MFILNTCYEYSTNIKRELFSLSSAHSINETIQPETYGWIRWASGCVYYLPRLRKHLTATDWYRHAQWGGRANIHSSSFEDNGMHFIMTFRPFLRANVLLAIWLDCDPEGPSVGPWNEWKTQHHFWFPVFYYFLLFFLLFVLSLLHVPEKTPNKKYIRNKYTLN